MEIRTKLSYQFIGIVALILLLSLVSIYFSFSEARKEEFYDRLGNKARLVAQMLIDIDEIDSELLRKIEKNNPLSLPNEKIIIFNYKNEMIFSSDDEELLNFTESHIHQARLENEIRFKQNGYEVYGEYYKGQYDRIVVFAAATDIFGMYKLKRLRIIMLFVFFISLLIVYIAGRLFAIRALKPISRMVSQVNAIEASSLNDRIDEGNEKDEIAHLAQTFNSMLNRLESAFHLQKQFIANASHELRTPLTIITGQIDVVLMQARSNEEYRNTLVLVLNEIKDLNSLSNKLLMLAQTSNNTSRTNYSPVRIDDVLWKAQNEVLTRNIGYTVDVNFGEGIVDDSKLLVEGNELLIKTCIINLIDNACKYSDNHHTNIILDADNEKLFISFHDSGIGIEPKDLNLIFEPFYRATNAMQIAGHGIGLSLVQRIIASHNGNLEVESIPGKGSTFTISLPILI